MFHCKGLTEDCEGYFPVLYGNVTVFCQHVIYTEKGRDILLQDENSDVGDDIQIWEMYMYPANASWNPFSSYSSSAC